MKYKNLPNPHGLMIGWEDDGPFIYIDSMKLDECIEFIKINNLKRINAASYYGFALDNLNFLKEIPFVEHILIVKAYIKDVSGIYSLKNLRSFQIDKRRAVDFSKLKYLESASLSYVKGDIGIGESKIERLTLNSYGKNSIIDIPSSVKYLGLNFVFLSKIEELPNLIELNELNISYCKSLQSIAGIMDKLPKLQKLFIQNCPNIPLEERKVELNIMHQCINDIVIMDGKKVLIKR